MVFRSGKPRIRWEYTFAHGKHENKLWGGINDSRKKTIREHHQKEERAVQTNRRARPRTKKQTTKKEPIVISEIKNLWHNSTQQAVFNKKDQEKVLCFARKGRIISKNKKNKQHLKQKHAKKVFWATKTRERKARVSESFQKR